MLCTYCIWLCVDKNCVKLALSGFSGVPVARVATKTACAVVNNFGSWLREAAMVMYS